MDDSQGRLLNVSLLPGQGSRHQPRPRLPRSRPGRRLRRRSGPAHVVQQDQHPRHPPRL